MRCHVPSLIFIALNGMTNFVSPLYIVGDIHGLYGELIERIDKYGLKDCRIICVGDFGAGFGRDSKVFSDLNEKFVKRGIHFSTIRGNHDDPSYFQGKGYSNLLFLKDYTTLEINGERILVVGGGVSIDRTARVLNRSYWVGEEIVVDEKNITECDVLITHAVPSWNGHADKDGIAYWCDRDPTLWEDCKAERRAIDTLIKLSKCKRHYCGHFHMFAAVEHNGCYSRIIDELEFVEHR